MRQRLRREFLTAFLCISSLIGQLQATDTTRLVGYWRFEGDFTDSSSYGNNAIGHGAGFSVGRFGYGILLNGIEWVEVPDATSLDLDDFTIEAWVRLVKVPAEAKPS
ncbi:MAG: hypothetical protein HY645_00995 [Acidobacteria bacterium]|nr:hypothetical protein [Acidobacteriota bacterium]